MFPLSATALTKAKTPEMTNNMSFESVILELNGNKISFLS